MALRNQPYLPLYVNDFLTDEKLIECSAKATGVYIRLLCIMHKSKEYGTILLKQNDIQEQDSVKNFAIKLSKQMPYSLEVIEKSLEELITENVVEIKAKKSELILVQKRMVKDNILSEIRAKSGRKGGIKTNICRSKMSSKTQAKVVANTEYEIEYENININNKDKGGVGGEGKGYSQEFLNFYNTYPNKKEKQEAWKVWQKINGVRPKIEVILKAVQDQIKWREEAEDGEFRPEWKHPATWLNKGCWEDDLTKPEVEGNLQKFYKKAKAEEDAKRGIK